MSKREIIFDEEAHKYYVDRTHVPNVSTILSDTVFKNKYKTPSTLSEEHWQSILDNAAQFGTNVHNAIENNSSKGLTKQEQKCYMDWLLIKKEQELDIKEQEQIVYYVDEETDEVLFIGTFDMTFEIDGTLYLGDIKTTSKLDKKYLSYQLTFYKMAYEQRTGKKINNLAVIWLPKSQNGRFEEIDILSSEEVFKVIDMYKEVQAEKASEKASKAMLEAKETPRATGRGEKKLNLR